jgi:hypothetical protein
MDHFFKKSKHPMNCLSNHKIIGLLIHRGMGISNDPLPEVPVPTPVPSIIANPKQPIPMSVVINNEEQSNPMHSTAPKIKTLTVTTSKSTSNTKHKIKRTSHTTQKHLDSIEPKQLNPMPSVLVEPLVDNTILGPSHEPQPSAATTFVQ